MLFNYMDYHGQIQKSKIDLGKGRRDNWEEDNWVLIF
jgi:hypothetical protein